jgi:hypothetical protein
MQPTRSQSSKPLARFERGCGINRFTAAPGLLRTVAKRRLRLAKASRLPIHHDAAAV